jgi:hypothetical protein
MKTFKFIVFIIFVIMLACCKKTIDCDNAKVVVKNIGTDTIYYCWGCNMYDSILAPGQMATSYVGQIHVGGSYEQTSVASFCTSGATYAIEVNECVEYREIE